MTSVRVAVVDYRMSNLASVTKALERVGAVVTVASTAEALGGADAVVLPGVGNFGQATERLAADGLDHAVRRSVAAGTPLLGICLGMQLLFDSSEESPGATGLGLIPGAVRRLRTPEKVPNVGWREATWQGVRGNDDTDAFYFNHSYACEPADLDQVLARSEHGVRFCAAAGTEAVMGVQFHPEKSSRAGLALLERWLLRVATGVAA